MNSIPTDTIGIVISFLTMPEIIHAIISHKDFHISHVIRKKTFQWCKRKIHNHKRIIDGKCAHHQCTFQKSVCYHMEPLRTQTLSPYCSQHTREILQFDIIELLK